MATRPPDTETPATPPPPAAKPVAKPVVPAVVKPAVPTAQKPAAEKPPEPPVEETAEAEAEAEVVETSQEETEAAPVASAAPALAPKKDSGLVTVTLVEGEFFGYGHMQFHKGVPKQVTPDIAEILATKTIKSGQVIGNRVKASEIPRFRIGTPRARTR